MSTLHLTCGLPCAGKTTLALELEREHNALRLTSDEWMIRFFGPDRHDRAWEEATRSRLEQAMFDMALRVLALGTDVILDFGVWSREEREDFRGRAAAIGARSELHFVDAPLDALIRRVHARNAALPPGTYPIAEQEMREFATWLQRPDADELLPREPTITPSG